jgi:D-amino-acid dehydrogenase
VSAKRVIVVGGGIAGLGVARGLVRRGVAVTVLERGTVGGGATWGSAGWICPAQAGPLPEPDALRYGLRSLVDRTSALYVDPRRLPGMLPWLARFARACTAERHAAGVRTLATFARRSFELLDELAADGAALRAYKQGIVVASTRERPLRDFLHSMAPARQCGLEVPTELLVGGAVRELEPALSPASRYGAFIAEHWHLDSAELATAIADVLRRAGVTIEEHTEVLELLPRGVRTEAGVLDADAVVLAAGAWSPALRRMPVLGGKGYSFTVQPTVMPRHSLLFVETHVACSPFSDRLRVAGTMEFSGLSSPVDVRRVESIKARTRSLIGWDESTESDTWAGLRPVAPDGMPIVGRWQDGGDLYVATGYSMLGITLGLPLGEALAAVIVGGEDDPELGPLSPGRFARRYGRDRVSTASTL